MSPCIVIVDGFSTGLWLAEHLAQRGATLVHVTSRSRFPARYWEGFRDAPYAALFDSCAELANSSYAGMADWVIPGNESGVALADELSVLWGLPGNDPVLTSARIDKAAMAAALDSACVRFPRSRGFTDVEGALQWLRGESLDRCVVKPRASSASDGVRLVKDLSQLSKAFHDVLASPTILGNRNTETLVGEWLETPEVYVNTVTYDGHVTYEEAWLSVKSVTDDGVPQYDYQEPLSATNSLATSIGAYLRPALAALGLRWGAAHSEVMHTVDGPALIDMGARLGGGSVPEVERRLCGDSQSHAYARMLLDNEPVSRVLAGSRLEVRRVWLNNQYDGIVGDLTAFGALRTLETTRHVSAHVQDGLPLNRTTHLVDSPGYVLLASTDRAALELDHARIREMESAGPFYGTRP